MNKKYVFIALAVVAVIALGVTAYVLLKGKKDNESQILDWIQS